MQKVTLRQMFEAGIHFGHKERYWNPKMAEYIYGARQGIHIINLEASLPRFIEAQRFVAKLMQQKGKVLFVGTKPVAKKIIKEEAERCGMPYVDYRWLGGMLTNYKTIRQSVKRYTDLQAMFESDRALEQLTKKERLNLSREKEKLSRAIGGIVHMGGLPDAIFVLDVGHEHIAIREARRLKIPVIGVVDTNGNPDGIDYMIPGNDDALRAVRFYCETLANTIIEICGEPKSPEELKAETTKPVIVKKAAAKTVTAAAEAPAKAETVEKPAAKKKVVAKKKVAAKKPAAKKAAAKKPAAKKAPATKAAAKKAAAKKAPAKKKTTKKDTEE